MRRVLVIALVGAFAVTACGGSKDTSISTVTFAGGSTTAASGGAAAATTSSSLAVTSSATTTATTAPATTTTLPVTTVAPNVPSTDVLPSNVSPPTTVRNTAADPEDAAIFATYRATWDGYVWTASHPDDPRWDWLDKTVDPSNRAAWRQEIEDRWAKGEVLNADGGLVTNPHVFDRTPRVTDLFDCRTTGVFWVDRASGQAVAGEDTTTRLEGWFASMLKVNGTWYTGAANIDTDQRRVTECGA